MTYRCVLFDLDGTLVDGRRGILRAMQHALRAKGIERTDERLSYFIGPPLHEVFSEHFGFSEADTLAAVDKYREYYADTGVLEVELYPGIPELLEALRGDAQLAVATSKPHVYARQILEHFELLDHFGIVSGPELDGTRRHKPEIIEHALGHLGGPPRDQTVMIGDRFYDVRGARKTGVNAISVGWGFGSPDELRDAKPDAHAETVHELHQLLSSKPR
jgi:phosphoglycolate phosphatase